MKHSLARQMPMYLARALALFLVVQTLLSASSAYAQPTVFPNAVAGAKFTIDLAHLQSAAVNCEGAGCVELMNLIEGGQVALECPAYLVPIFQEAPILKEAWKIASEKAQGLEPEYPESWLLGGQPEWDAVKWQTGGTHAGHAVTSASEFGAASKGQRLDEEVSEGAKAGLLRLRQAYVDEVKALEGVALDMRASGASSEQVARQLHQMRRDLGVRYKGLTPAVQVEVVYARNLERYGDKLGPTVDWLRAKGKSWEQIIESASRPGGKDLGF